jgi:hypothetical protein
VQIGYLPASPSNPAVLVTAVYLWNNYINADGIPSHVYLKVSNLE